MSTKIYTIYKATNLITNKCYIGFDSCWPNRIKTHKNSKKKYKFQRAAVKYGWESFEWEILYKKVKTKVGECYRRRNCIKVSKSRHFYT